MSAIYEPDDDVEKIKNSFNEKNYDPIIEILCKRKNEQIQKIKNQYKSLYGEVLNEKIEENFKDDLKNLLLSLSNEPIENDVDELFKSMDGLGTDDDTLTEILSTTPPYKFKEISEKYENKYNRSLEKDVIGDTSKAYQRLLVALIQGKRRENPYPNIKKIKEIVEELKVNDGEKLDKDIFVKHFALSSPSEMVMILYYYEKQYKESLMKFIEDNFGSDSRNLYKTLIDYNSNPAKYYAMRLHTWENKIIIRTFTKRREIDLEDIKKEYKKLYGKELIEDLKYNIKGDFEKALENILLKDNE